MMLEIIETLSVILKTERFKMLLSTVKSVLIIHVITAEMSNYCKL